jgi:4-hydroxybenzoate polyprenyltransferase
MLSKMLGPLSVLCLGAVVLFVFFSALGAVSPSEVLLPSIVCAALALLLMVRSLIVRHELGEKGNRNVLRSVHSLRERRGF